MRLWSGHILPRNASNFTCSHLDLKNFPRGETPDPCLHGPGMEKEGRGKGYRVSTSKKGEGRKDESRRGMGK